MAAAEDDAHWTSEEEDTDDPLIFLQFLCQPFRCATMPRKSQPRKSEQRHSRVLHKRKTNSKARKRQAPTKRRAVETRVYRGDADLPDIEDLILRFRTFTSVFKHIFKIYDEIQRYGMPADMESRNGHTQAAYYNIAKRDRTIAPLGLYLEGHAIFKELENPYKSPAVRDILPELKNLLVELRTAEQSKGSFTAGLISLAFESTRAAELLTTFISIVEEVIQRLTPEKTPEKAPS